MDEVPQNSPPGPGTNRDFANMLLPYYSSGRKHNMKKQKKKHSPWIKMNGGY